MTKRAESIGLFIGSDGPNGSGNYEKTGNFNLFMKGGNPTDPVQYSAEGVKHFNNWKAGLSSLETTNKERFEFEHATEYLGYSFHAEKVKILDDLAVIAYPEYTDINKIVWEHEQGALYIPIGCGGYIAYDVIDSNCAKIVDGGFMPLVNRKDLDDADVDGYFENLLFMIEYDGYYTKADGTLGYLASLDGLKEVFTYSAGQTEDFGKYYFLDGVTEKFPVLNSRFGGNVAGTSDFTDGNVRYGTNQVTADTAQLGAMDEELKTIYKATYGVTSTVTIEWGFLGYQKAHLIKYAPAVKCGRVDVLHRKSGIISSISSRAVATSNYHDLQSGDIIKVTAALDSDSKDEYMNGLKYVQVNTSHTFTLYDDSTFLTRTDTSTLSTRSAVSWVLVGSVYDENRQGWSHKKTLFSPDGRNGYTHSGSYGSETNSPLPVEYQHIETYYDLLELDIEYNSIACTALDPYDSNIAVRNRYSRLDAMWSGPAHVAKEYRFGSDIDFKKINGQYRLLVGEMGPDEIIDFMDGIENMPNKAPYGKAHLFTISLDVNKTLTVTVDQRIDASTGTSGAITTPPEMYSACSDDGYFFYDTDLAGARIDTATSQSSNSLTQEYRCPTYTLDTTYKTDNYWWGAMLYHLPDKLAIEANAIGQFAASDNGYFTNRNLCYYETGTTGSDDCGLTFYDFYPYVDNFGKSVALDYSLSKVLVAVGSTTKTDLTTTPESTSCGPVHVFDATATVSSVQRINSSSDVATPSGVYEAQVHKARRFASCMVAVNGYLAFGKSRPYEVQYQGSYEDFTNEVSSVLIYRFGGSTYAYDSSVVNQNDNAYTYITTDDISGNYKELKLRDLDYTATNTYIRKFWFSDRFGDNFDFNGYTVVTNAFDNYNDAGYEHTDDSVPDSLCDYLHVYERFGDRWKFVAKIAASIDSEDTKYDYDSFVYPNNYLSLRNLANRSYANTTTYSVTWDIDLTKCYALADDRIVLKDPLGYAIFSRNWRYANTDNITSQSLVSADMYNYFKYSENFKCYDNGNLVHTKLSKLHKYDTTSVVKCYASLGDQAAEYKTPVYFMSLPTSVTVNSVSFYVRFDDDPTGVRMLLYKDDPRLEVLLSDNYTWMDDGYDTGSDIPGDLFVVGAASDGNKIFKLGAVDASVYHETTLTNEQPFAKLISPTSVSSANVARFDVSLIDLATYRISGSKLQSTTRVYETGVAASHKEIVMADTTKSTYDSNIDIQDTLIVGFIYGDILEKNYYTVPYDAVDIDYEATITDFDAIFNASDSSLTSNGKANFRLYDCVVDKVATYSNAKRQYQEIGGTGKNRYTNPLLGLGISTIPTHNDQTGEDLVLEGTAVKSYQIFSVDNFDTLESWEVTNGADTWSNENYYEENRSWDINKLDYLSLYIANNVGSTGNINLFMSNVGTSSGIAPLYIGNSGTTNNINLYLENVSSSGTTPLFVHGNTGASGQTTLVMYNQVTGVTKQATLFLENTTRTGLMPLVIKSLDPTGVTSSHDLYIYGNSQSVTYKESELNLLINGMSAGEKTEVMPLMMNAPTSVEASGNLMPLFISSFRDSGTLDSTMSMYMYNADTVDINGRVHRTGVNLFLNATYGSTGTMPLYLSRRGTNGEEEVGNQTTLFIHNSQSTGNISLYLDAVYGSTGNVNLVIPYTYGGPTGVLSTFIRGYRDD